MAYELTAIVGVGPAPELTVALPQGAWLLPLGEEDSAALACRLSLAGPVALVEAEFFGGVGGQCASLFAGGREAREFAAGYGAINAALEALGLVAEPPHDLFDTLRLGRYRFTEEWAKAATCPPPSPSL